MLAVNVRTRRRKLRPTARLAVANAGVSYAGATAWAGLPYRFEDPGDSSSKEWLRALVLALPKPLKRGKALFFSFSIVLRRSVCFSTSCRLMRRNPPDSPAGGRGAAAAASGLAGALAAEASSSTLLCDLRRPVKRPSPGLPMARRCVCACAFACCLKRTAQLSHVRGERRGSEARDCGAAGLGTMGRGGAVAVGSERGRGCWGGGRAVLAASPVSNNAARCTAQCRCGCGCNWGAAA